MANDYGKRRRLVAPELRDLADEIEERLPEKGALISWARGLEKALDEMRPYRDPRARVKQAKLLGRLLSKRTRVDVALIYRAEKNWRGIARTYEVRWTNGPTDMKEHVTALANRVPDLDIDHLEYQRSSTTRAELAAMLRHLDQKPEDGRIYAATRTNQFGGGQYNQLHDLASDVWWDATYPERVDDQSMRRVRAIYSLDPRGRVNGHEPTNEAWLRLGNHILAHGWRATRDWLDQIAAGLDNPDVTRLDQHRQRPAPQRPNLEGT